MLFSILLRDFPYIILCGRIFEDLVPRACKVPQSEYQIGVPCVWCW